MIPFRIIAPLKHSNLLHAIILLYRFALLNSFEYTSSSIVDLKTDAEFAHQSSILRILKVTLYLFSYPYLLMTHCSNMENRKLDIICQYLPHLALLDWSDHLLVFSQQEHSGPLDYRASSFFCWLLLTSLEG